MPLEAGDYTFAGMKAEVIHSPGHSPGSALFYFPDEGLLFLGDTIAFWGIPSFDLENSNVPDLFDSLTRLKNLDIPDSTEIFFGHGEKTTYGDMLKKFDCFTKPLVISVKPHNGEMT